MLTHQISGGDLIWLLGYPLYQVLYTPLHESAHAIAGLLKGERIEKFVFWPSYSPNRFSFGHVIFKGGRSDTELGWFVAAAPYIFDFTLFLITFAYLQNFTIERHWTWLNLVIIGLVAPLINSSFQYLLGLVKISGDVGALFKLLPKFVVHIYFVITLSLYAVGILFTLVK